MAKYPILTLSDRKVAEALIEISTVCDWAGTMTIECTVFGLRVNGQPNEFIEKATSEGFKIGPNIKSERFNLLGQNHQSQGQPLNITIVRGHFSDEIEVVFGGSVNIAKRDPVLDLIERHFHRCSTYSEFEGVVNAENKASLTHLQASTQQLEKALEKLIATGADIHANNLEATEARRFELEEEYKERTSRKESALAARDAALNEREKLIDVSDNTTARRKLREDFKEEVSKARQKNRFFRFMTRSLIIHFMFLGICVFLAITAFSYGQDLSEYLSQNSGFLDAGGSASSDGVGLEVTVPALNTSVFMSLAVKGSVAAVGTLMMAIYYIRWFDGSLKRLDREEVRLERALVDIDRSSWLVEIALEWKKVYPDDPIPVEILERLSRGVFEEGEESVSAVHPTEEAMAALLGSSKRITAKFPNGSSLDLDGKSIAKARKTVDS